MTLTLLVRGPRPYVMTTTITKPPEVAELRIIFGEKVTATIRAPAPLADSNVMIMTL